MTVAILALRCPRCGLPLDGADNDVAWICGPCGVGVEAELRGAEASLRERPVFLIVPPDGAPFASPIATLPFWRLALRIHATGPDGAAVSAVQAAARDRIYVRAFWLRNGFIIGDPGIALTDAEFSEVRARGPGVPATRGIAIGSTDAARLGELFVLRAADRVRDVASVLVRTEVLSVELALIPFAVVDDALVCPVTGRQLRRELFDELTIEEPLGGR